MVLLVFFLLVVLQLCLCEKVHYCDCVNVSRFNLQTKEHETWCVPILESFEATRSLYKDEVPSGYKKDGFPPVRVGDVIGNYTVLSRLGNGAFATVWEAENDLAIKLTRADSTHMADDEIKALTEMGPHPNIVRLIDSFIVESRLGSHRAIVMGKLHGKNLELAKETLGVAEARIVARDISRALAHSHESGWIHTDLVTQRKKQKKKFFFFTRFSLVFHSRRFSLSFVFCSCMVCLSPADALFVV